MKLYEWVMHPKNIHKNETKEYLFMLQYDTNLLWRRETCFSLYEFLVIAIPLPWK